MVRRNGAEDVTVVRPIVAAVHVVEAGTKTVP